MVEIKLKGFPNEDIVQGYPGVPATWPRIQATVEIRGDPKDLAKDQVKPLGISKVTAGLYRTDTINTPSNIPSLTTNKREQSFLISKQKDLFNGSESVFALDLPFILSMPTNRPIAASMSLGKVAETIYYIFVSVEFKANKLPVEHARFPVCVRRYDTLSTFSMFHNPITNIVKSPDHYVNLQFTIPTSAYGPRDVMMAYFKIYRNEDWGKAKKAKLKRISLELVQIIKFPPAPANVVTSTLSRTLTSSTSKSSSEFDRSSMTSSQSAPTGAAQTEIPDKRTRVAKVAKDFQDTKLDGDPIIHEFAMTIPDAQLEDKDGVIPKQMPGVPDEGRIGFSTSSSLYKVEFMLVFKARLSHARDIEVECPVTISQFDHATSMSYMKTIMETAEMARMADKSSPNPVLFEKPLEPGVIIR